MTYPSQDPQPPSDPAPIMPYEPPPPYGQNPYGQAPYGQQPYGQAPYAPYYGQAPYDPSVAAQAPYGQPPYGQAGPYGPPSAYAPYGYGYGYGYGMPQRSPEGMAIASLVVSIAAVFAICTYGVGGILGLVGAILGHVARRRCVRNGTGGAGLALAGIIVGWTLFGLSLIGGIVLLIAFTSSGSGTYT